MIKSQQSYSHSIECLNREGLDISSVSILSCLIGDELRGCFEFCMRTGGQRVKSEIPYWLLRIFSLPFQWALRLQRYTFSVILTTSEGCIFLGFLWDLQNSLGLWFGVILFVNLLHHSTVTSITPPALPPWVWVAFRCVWLSQKFSEIFHGVCQVFGCAIFILSGSSVTAFKCTTLFF